MLNGSVHRQRNKLSQETVNEQNCISKDKKTKRHVCLPVENVGLLNLSMVTPL